MATLYEYLNSGDTDVDWVSDTVWEAQTFTPGTAHKITSVKLLLYRAGSPGTITVGIRATNTGLPTGNDLCVGTTNGNTLPTGAPYEWREITLGAGFELSADTLYAIVIRTETTDVAWRRATDNPYAGGTQITSLDSGDTWSSKPTMDFMFEDWGEPLAVGRSQGYILS